MRYYQPPQQQVVRIGNPQQQAQNVAFNMNLMNQMYQNMMQSEGMKSQALGQLYNTEFYDSAMGEKINEVAGKIGSLDMASPLLMAREVSRYNQELAPWIQANKAQMQAIRDYDSLASKLGDDVMFGTDPRKVSLFQEGRLTSPEAFKNSYYRPSVLDNELKEIFKDRTKDVISYRGTIPMGEDYLHVMDTTSGLSQQDLDMEFLPFFNENTPNRRAFEKIEKRFATNEEYAKVWLSRTNGNMPEAIKLAAEDAYIRAQNVLGERISTSTYKGSSASTSRGRGSDTPPTTTADITFPATPGSSEGTIKGIEDKWNIISDGGGGMQKVPPFSQHYAIGVGAIRLPSTIRTQDDLIKNRELLQETVRKARQEVIDSDMYKMLTSYPEGSYQNDVLQLTGSRFPDLIDHWEDLTGKQYKGQTEEQLLKDLGVNRPLTQNEAFEVMKNYEIETAVKHNTSYEIPDDAVGKSLQKSIASLRLTGEGIRKAFEFIDGKKVETNERLQTLVGEATEVMNLNVLPSTGDLVLTVKDSNRKLRNVVIPSNALAVGVSDNLAEMGDFMSDINSSSKVSGNESGYYIAGETFNFRKVLRNGKIETEVYKPVVALRNSGYTPQRDYGMDLAPFAQELDFLQREESGVDANGQLKIQTEGYIPKSNGKILGVSGVTVGVGVDLGQQSESQLRADGVPESIMEKIKPYIGLKLEAADNKLKKSPLSLTPEEALELSNRVQTRFIHNLESEIPQFKTLPSHARSVILSLTYQYGSGGRDKYFKDVVDDIVSGNYAQAASKLESKTAYVERRKREAALLRNPTEAQKKVINPSTLTAEDFVRVESPAKLSSVTQNLLVYTMLGLGYKANIKSQNLDPYNP